MSQKNTVDMRETVSALVDGEASNWELRKALQQSTDDDSLTQDWAAYQAVRAVLRKEPQQGVDISQDVMQALDKQPSYSRLDYFRRSIGQTAIAASVAVIALLGVQQYQVADSDPAGATGIAESTLQTDTGSVVQSPEGFDLQAVTRPVSASSAQSPLTAGNQIQIPVDRDQLKRHLDEVVQQHSENLVDSNQAVIPMVRIPASSEAE